MTIEEFNNKNKPYIIGKLAAYLELYLDTACQARVNLLNGKTTTNYEVPFQILKDFMSIYAGPPSTSIDAEKVCTDFIITYDPFTRESYFTFETDLETNLDLTEAFVSSDSITKINYNVAGESIAEYYVEGDVVDFYYTFLSLVFHSDFIVTTKKLATLINQGKK